MSAPDIATLFAYEDAIEPSWQAILTAAGLTAVTEFSDAIKVTPYVDVQLRDAQPTGHKTIHQGEAWFDAWTGTLVSRVVTVRGKNSNAQGPSLGKIRLAGQKIRENWTTVISPYFALAEFRESDLQRGVSPDFQLDWSELRHTIRFSIRPDAWPA